MRATVLCTSRGVRINFSMGGGQSRHFAYLFEQKSTMFIKATTAVVKLGLGRPEARLKWALW